MTPAIESILILTLNLTGCQKENTVSMLRPNLFPIGIDALVQSIICVVFTVLWFFLHDVPTFVPHQVHRYRKSRIIPISHHIPEFLSFAFLGVFVAVFFEELGNILAIICNMKNCTGVRFHFVYSRYGSYAGDIGAIPTLLIESLKDIT